jgi:hypothetical protein
VGWLAVSLLALEPNLPINCWSGRALTDAWRITGEETNDPDEVDAFIDRSLRNLAIRHSLRPRWPRSGPVPWSYALSTSEQARELSGPPHHIQRLTTMAAMAIAVGLVGVLAAFQTRGWRISAWCVGAAALVLGLGLLLFPNYRGSAGGGWGAFAAGSGLLYIVVAEVRAKRDRSRREPG